MYRRLGPETRRWAHAAPVFDTAFTLHRANQSSLILDRAMQDGSTSHWKELLELDVDSSENFSQTELRQPVPPRRSQPPPALQAATIAHAPIPTAASGNSARTVFKRPHFATSARESSSLARSPSATFAHSPLFVGMMASRVHGWMPRTATAAAPDRRAASGTGCARAA